MLQAEELKSYKNMTDLCRGIEGTIVVLSNRQIESAELNSKNVERARERNGDINKAVNQLAEVDDAWRRQIDKNASLWRDLSCATILYGKK